LRRGHRPSPEVVARSVEIAGRCRFSLDELQYQYSSVLQSAKSDGVDGLSSTASAKAWSRGAPQAKNEDDGDAKKDF
jgi:hypothetical protein